MVRKGFILTGKEATELFLILSQARLKLTTKYKTVAEKYWKKFEEVLDLNPDKHFMVECDTIAENSIRKEQELEYE